MGSGSSKHEKEQQQKNKQIELDMLKEQKEAKKIIKLLLLGTIPIMIMVHDDDHLRRW